MGEVEFAEVSIPLALAAYYDPHSGIGSILQATQEMVNEASEAMAKAEAFPPPYNPYVTPDYSTHHRLSRMAFHANALNKWQTRVTRAQEKKGLSFQMRFVAA